MLQKFKQKIPLRLSLIMPYVLLAGLFIIFPSIMLFTKAFTPVETVAGNSNFISTIKEGNITKMLGRSIFLGLIAAGISLILLFPFTWIVSRTKSVTFKMLSIILIISPLLIFSIAKVFSLKILLLNIFDGGSEMPQQNWIMIIGMVYLYSPYMVIPLYAILKSMPASLLEASNDLGFNTPMSIFKVVFPYSAKGIFSGIAVVFMLSSTSLVMSKTLLNSYTNDHTLIGNFIDKQTSLMLTSKVAAQKGSSIALITLASMMAVYGVIYLSPMIFKKIKRRIND